MEYLISKTTKNIAQQTKNDINLLIEANRFLSSKEEVIKKLNFSANQIISSSIGSIEFIIWSYLSFNNEEFIEFLNKLNNQNKGWVSWKKFRGFGRDIKLGDIEVIDRIDYSVKFLSKHFDLPIPNLMKERIDGMPISIKNTSWYGADLIEELDLFINRVLMLISNSEKLNSQNNNQIDQIKNDWIQKLTKNRLSELLNEMRQFYQLKQNNDIIFKLILLQQRLSKLIDQRQLAIRDITELEVEENKITKSILEIIQDDKV